MDQGTKNKVNAIIAEHLGSSETEIIPTAKLQDDLGADSLDIVELVMQFEEAFDIEIPDEAIDRIRTVQDIYDYLEREKVCDRYSRR